MIREDTAGGAGLSLEERRDAERAKHGRSRQAAVRSAKRTGNYGLIPLIRQPHNAFGSSKAGDDYYSRIKTSMGRYERLRASRPNLFCFIMPAGHGKTHYSEKFGVVDVDELVAPRTHNQLVEMRYEAQFGGSTWTNHNNKWTREVSKTLDLFDYSGPVVVLVHHEEVALEIGATILGAFRLAETSFEMNIRDRSPHDQLFSRSSYRSWDHMVYKTNRFDKLTNKEVERLLIKTLCVNNLPVAAPQMYEANVSRYYSRCCPRWLLEGKDPPDREIDISELVKFYESGDIPKECVDYYVRRGYTVTSLDFGVTLNDWAGVLAQVSEGLGEYHDFNPKGDMMEIFPPREPKEATRANVTLRRLDETFGVFEHEDVYDLCCHHVGEPHVFVSGLVSAWKGLMVELPFADLVAPWFLVRYDAWPRVLKAIHTLVRTSRFIMHTEMNEYQRQRLMYLDLLVGRSSYVINELGEVDKRGGDTYESEHLSYDPKCGMFTRAQYREDFQVGVRTAYARMRYTQQPKLRIRSFLDFYKRRKTWLTKGSLVYNHIPPHMKRVVVRAFDSLHDRIIELEGRHNKQSLFEEIELREFLSLVGGPDDFNVTKTMPKYETGRKDRTLLPGSAIHFFVTTYVLELAERLEQVGSVRLNALPDEDFIWFDRKMVTGLYHVLYDWADFNEQHSADEMALVISELEHVVNAPEDYAYFVQAVVESTYNMQLHDREGKRHKLWKGLFSGWRNTTWTNTVLNFVYVATALTSYERIYGDSPVVYMDHGGDDIDGALDNAVAMPRFMAIMDNMLFNANQWKQMFSNRSEFFRNTITSGRAYASPTRALASFVAGDWEGSGNVTMRERVTNVLDQVGKMVRRGVPHDFGNGLALCALTHWCKLRIEDSWVNMPAVVLHGAEEDGGLGVPDWDGMVWRLDREVPDMSGEWLAMLKPSMLSSRDYVEVLARDVESLSLELSRKEELATRLAEDAYDVETRIDRFNWQQLVEFKAEIIDKVPVVRPRYDERVFDDFVHFRVTDAMVRRYSRASRYTELVGFLSINGRELSHDDIVRIAGENYVSKEAIDFAGSPFYRRLVPDFVGQKITYFCREAINVEGCSSDEAEEVFEILCCMAREVFGHAM